DEVRKWGRWINEEAQQALAEFYPSDPNGGIPVAYLWARTIKCEGPGCGAELPLIRSLWLAKKSNESVALAMRPNDSKDGVDFVIVENAKKSQVQSGTVQRGSATCPICNFTTPVASVRRQLSGRNGGAADARAVCVVTTRPNGKGRSYRITTPQENE